MLQSSHPNRRSKRSLSRSAEIHNKRQSPSCQLYTSPVLATVLPVYAPLTLTWNPSCVKFSAPNVDLFLSVLQADGLVPVHRWTGVPYAAGQLATQLNPTWWNASTGAGSVRAQLVMTPVGNPIWNTAAPSGPLFAITYNGSYPSVTASAGAAIYTGPSVESVSDPTSTTSVSGGKLAAAVVIPILALAGLLAAYIIWNKSKKKPEKKRWSQAIDQRMSMMSQGSWAPPRPSTSSSARPTSMYDPSRPSLGHRPSPSLHSVGPMSASSPLRSASFVGGNDLSPTKSAPATSPLAPRRPLSTATSASTEMRQIGQGERMSRVSFASERPAMVGGKEKPNRTSYHGRKSIGSAVRTSMAGSMAGSMASLEPESPPPPPKSDMARSETTEELANPLVPAKPAYRRAHSSQRSVSSSLRQEVVGSGDATNSFSDSSSNPLPKPAAAVVASHSHMPMAKRNSMLTPDEAMASYHAARGEVPPLPIPSSKSTGSLRRPGIGRSASMTFLRSASGRILKSLQKEKNGLGSTNEDSEDGPVEASPFNDPDSSPSSSNHSTSSKNNDEKSPFDSSRDDLTPPSLPRSLSNTPIAERFATTVYAASTPRTPPTPESTPLPIPTNRHLSAVIDPTTARNSVADSVYSQDGVDPAQEGPKAM